MSKTIYLAVEIDDDDIDLTTEGQMRLLEELTYYMDASTLAPAITSATLSIEPPPSNAELLAAAKRALDWFSAYNDSEIVCTEPEVAKPLLECEKIMTQLDSAIAAADPDFVC